MAALISGWQKKSIRASQQGQDHGANMWSDIIAFKHRERKKFGPRHHMDAVGAAAQADKRVNHFPFGGGVKESQFFAAADRPGGSDQHACGVQVDIRAAGMIRIGQRADLNMKIFANLDRILGRAGVGGGARQLTDDFSLRKAAFGQKAFVTVSCMDDK